MTGRWTQLCPRRARNRALLTTLAALGVLSASASPAQATPEDPFALPRAEVVVNKAPANPDALFVEVVVDGEPATGLIALDRVGGEWVISGDDAVRLGLVKKTRRIAPTIPLSALAKAAVHLDLEAQRLEIDRYGRYGGPNTVDMGRTPRLTDLTTPVLALIADYDLTTTVTQGSVTAAGLVDTRLVRGTASLDSSFTFGPTNSGTAGGGFVRLDTSATLALPRHGLVATLGDFVAVVSDSQRAVRQAGLQLATDFGIQPDLVPHPLPDFAGQVAVPTAVDLIVGDQRYSAGNVDPGHFAIRNVPVPEGRGDLTVVTHDALGREVVQNVPFYSSDMLLARGVNAAAINLGVVRRNYGVLSDDYGIFAASGMWRRGLSSTFTGEISGEIGGGVANGGISGTMSVAAVAAITLEGRLSERNGTAGGMLRGAIESLGRPLSVRIEAQRPLGPYADVAQASGDPPVPTEIAGFVALDLGRSMHIQFTGAYLDRPANRLYPAQRATVIGATLHGYIARRLDVFANVSERFAEAQPDSFTAFAGLSFRFGSRTNAQLLGSHDQGGNGIQASLSRIDAEPGDIGYSVQASEGELDRVAASVAWRTRQTRIEADVEDLEGSWAFRGNARGSLILADGDLWARNQSVSSFALVDTNGVADVPVLREHRPVGESDGSGKLLVTDIAGYVGQTFTVSDEKLPDDVIDQGGDVRAAIPSRAVGKVRLGTVRFEPRLLHLRDDEGRDLAPGTVLVALPSHTSYVVGMDGATEINGFMHDKALAAADCHAEIPRQATPARPDRVAFVTCHAGLGSAGLGSAGSGSGGSGSGGSGSGPGRDPIGH